MSTLTIEQVRDRIAELLRFSIECSQRGPYLEVRWVKREGGRIVQFIDPTTLDGIAALMPASTLLSFYCGCGHGLKGGAWYAGIDRLDLQFNAPTELEARTRLLLAVLETESKKGGA